MSNVKLFSLLHGLPLELVDKIYLYALHETILPDDVIRIISMYDEYTNRLTSLVNTYNRIRKTTSCIARSTFSAVRMRYDSFVRPSPYTGSVRTVNPEQCLRSGALALVSLRELLPYISEDCRVDLASFVQHNFERELTRKMTSNDKRAILNAKMLVLAGFEDCLELFDNKQRLKICGKLRQYHQEINSTLRPGEERHKVDDYRRIIRPRSEVKRHQLEEMVIEVQNWILPPAGKAKNLSEDAWYNEVDVKVGNVHEEINQGLTSDSIDELAYFVTRLAAIIKDCYRKETRLGVEKLGKHASGSDVRPV